jgi:hypothetical protein
MTLFLATVSIGFIFNNIVDHNTSVGIGIRCKLTRGISGGRAPARPSPDTLTLRLGGRREFCQTMVGRLFPFRTRSLGIQLS